MDKEKRSMVQRLLHWLFGDRQANRADQKKRRDRMATFLQEHAEEEERAVAAQEKRE